MAPAGQPDFKKIIDDHRTEVIRFLMVYGLSLGVFLVIWIYTGAVPIWFLIVIPFLIAILATLAVNWFGNAFGKGFYGGRNIHPTLEEEVRIELDKIRFNKRSGRFKEALQMIRELLIKVPDCPEALLLKAQIHHEQYGHHESARKCLQRIIDMVPEDREVHRWASEYLGQIALTANATQAKSTQVED